LIKSFILLALLLSISSPSFGFNLGKDPSITERIQTLEKSKEYAAEKNHRQYIADGEFLYWKADIDGAAYATITTDAHIEGAVGDLSTNIKTLTPHFSYDPGFRLALGLQTSHDLFDLCLVWTRFYTEGKDRARGTLVPVIPIPDDLLIFDSIGLIHQLTSIPNTASAECRLKGNLLDLQFGRGIEMTKRHFLRPYFGLRGVWCDMDWDISVNRDFLFPGILDQDATVLFVRNNFRAIGGLFGLEYDLKTSSGFGITARGAGALVYGLTEEKTKQNYYYVPNGTSTIIKQPFKAGNSFHSLKGLWELFLGLFWEAQLSKKPDSQYKLRLFAGYELQQWPLIAQKTNTQSTRERERFTLGFQGFTGGAKLVF